MSDRNPNERRSSRRVSHILRTNARQSSRQATQSLRNAIATSLVGVNIPSTSRVGDVYESLQSFLVPTSRPSIDVLLGLLNETNTLSIRERTWLNNQLEDQRWLDQVTIYGPSATGEQGALPDSYIARLMLMSPIALRFPSATEIIQGILHYYPNLREVFGRPETFIPWSVADHKAADEVWIGQTSVWHDWLQLLVESGLAPNYDADNPDIVAALNLGDGNTEQPAEYVLLWFLRQFGNFRLFQEEGTGKIIGLVDALRLKRWNETAMYAICPSLNELEPAMKEVFQRHVSLDADGGAGYLVVVLSQLMDFGATQDAFNRIVALGYSPAMLQTSHKAHLYVSALNSANYACLNLISSVFDPFSASRTAVGELRFLTMIRRDMWPYVLRNFSEDVGRKLRGQAKALLQYDEE